MVVSPPTPVSPSSKQRRWGLRRQRSAQGRMGLFHQPQPGIGDSHTIGVQVLSPDDGGGIERHRPLTPSSAPSTVDHMRLQFSASKDDSDVALASESSRKVARLPFRHADDADLLSATRKESRLRTISRRLNPLSRGGGGSGGLRKPGVEPTRSFDSQDSPAAMAVAHAAATAFRRSDSADSNDSTGRIIKPSILRSHHSAESLEGTPGGTADGSRTGGGYNHNRSRLRRNNSGGQLNNNGSGHGQNSGQPRNVAFDFSSMESLGSTAATTRSNDSTQQNEGQRATYGGYQGNKAYKKKHRVRPYHCFREPVHMTEEEIYADSLAVSKDFESLKSYIAPTYQPKKDLHVPAEISSRWGSPLDDGRIGAIRVEVLGCVSLARTKPDVAVYLVCGDAAFCTDVIHGYRSPMWPSVTRRAAVFPIHHAYAQLFLGVFDVRVRKNKENDVFCGRVSVDVAALRPDTEYDVTCPLRASTFIYDRHKRGVIRIRFSLHWFNERAVVLSYFKQPRPLTESIGLIGGQPTILCADPKTFRNVAITVHGQDLPGKYTRSAFRATTREFSLYNQNLQLLVKVLALDAVLYEKPYISIYLFLAAMYCVTYNSVRMVPPFFVGYLLILYLENYWHFVEESRFHLGYKPLTLWEIATGLLVNTNESKTSFNPIAVQKKTKARRSRSSKAVQRLQRLHSNEELKAGDDKMVEIEMLDHREFPFSERDAYPRFSVEDALAPGADRRASTTRLHGRLSVYYTSTSVLEETQTTGNTVDEDDSSGDSGDERDDETIMSESNMMGDSLYNIDYEGEDEDAPLENIEIPFAHHQGAGNFSHSSARAQRRIKVGPPQDNDVQGKKVPPQMHLKRIENLLHKASMGLSVEFVNTPSLLGRAENARAEILKAASAAAANTADAIQAQIDAINKKRAHLDEFDKLLGLEIRSANPVVRYASTFLGPLMRIIRILVYIFRISFNISTWRDPFLSFWVLIFMVLLFFVLVVFPWRAFFFITCFACLGPQNIFVRQYLEKKAAEREMEDSESTRDGRTAWSQQQSAKIESNASPVRRDERRGFFGRKGGTHKDRENASGKSRRSGELASPIAGSTYEAENFLDRPAFRSELWGQSSSSKKMQPRAVAIPYSGLKKIRFYDWPPDPTVSRATPIPLSHEVTIDEPVPPEVVFTSNTSNHAAEYPPGLRRRMYAQTRESPSEESMAISDD